MQHHGLRSKGLTLRGGGGVGGRGSRWEGEAVGREVGTPCARSLHRILLVSF